jgi:hypothetical protein
VASGPVLASSRMRLGVALIVVVVVGGVGAGGAPAHAGRTHYGWLYGSEINPEGSVELESWIFERNHRGGVDETALWWAPVIGVTEHLELVFPVEVTWHRSDMTAPVTQISRWGAEARYRVGDPDPATAGPLSGLFRVALKREVSLRDGVRGEADAILAFESGRVHAELDLGGIVLSNGASDGDTTIAEVRPSAGVSVRVVGDLRLGAETYGEIGVKGEVVDWMALGPDLAWTQGRFWLAATLGVGLYGVRTAPRVNLAVAF